MSMTIRLTATNQNTNDGIADDTGSFANPDTLYPQYDYLAISHTATNQITNGVNTSEAFPGSVNNLTITAAQYTRYEAMGDFPPNAPPGTYPVTIGQMTDDTNAVFVGAFVFGSVKIAPADPAVLKLLGGGLRPLYT